ncbi:hypothetical protein [Nibrella saemangeumensis]|uniref:hypothetical protein n=1 Tax=Nibrella saemangeumensis TaxID=1084526 RepID=UPI0031EF4C24
MRVFFVVRSNGYVLKPGATVPTKRGYVRTQTKQITPARRGCRVDSSLVSY